MGHKLRLVSSVRSWVGLFLQPQWFDTLATWISSPSFGGRDLPSSYDAFRANRRRARHLLHRHRRHQVFFLSLRFARRASLNLWFLFFLQESFFLFPWDRSSLFICTPPTFTSHAPAKALESQMSPLSSYIFFLHLVNCQVRHKKLDAFARKKAVLMNQPEPMQEYSYIFIFS